MITPRHDQQALPDALVIALRSLRVPTRTVALLSLAATVFIFAITIERVTETPLGLLAIAMYLLGFLLAGFGFAASSASRRVFHAMDRVTVGMFWCSGIFSMLAGTLGALFLASVAITPLMATLFTGSDNGVTAVIMSAIMAAFALGTCSLAMSGRFTDYTGITSFRRGSVFFPAIVVCEIAGAYAIAFLVVVVPSGDGFTAILVSVLLAIATATAAYLQYAHRAVHRAKNNLLEAIDVMQCALDKGDRNDVFEAALAFNRAYSTQTALRHPMVPPTMEVALDLVVSRAIGTTFWHSPPPQALKQPSLASLTPAAYRVMLSEACAILRRELILTRR